MLTPIVPSLDGTVNHAVQSQDWTHRSDIDCNTFVLFHNEKHTYLDEGAVGELVDSLLPAEFLYDGCGRRWVRRLPDGRFQPIVGGKWDVQDFIAQVHKEFGLFDSRQKTWPKIVYTRIRCLRELAFVAQLQQGGAA